MNDQDVLAIGLIAAGTFVSEDATCIATALLIRDGQLSWAVGLAGCILGIFVGDLALWLIGRVVGRRALRWSWVRGRLPSARVDALSEWFDRRGWIAVLTARFVPGTRLPVYVAAGALGRSGGRFAMWALIAALLWTPALVILVALLGGAVVPALEHFLGGGWMALVLAAGGIWLAVRVLSQVGTPVGRAKAWARLSRLWRWEFWPAWLFYVPLVPWIAWLAVRHRGLMTPTAANPGIEAGGGVVGESKYAILAKLPGEWVVPTALLEPGAAAVRVAALRTIIAERGWTFPLILKPDVGERGAGVRRVLTLDEAARVIDAHRDALIVQAYHPGPFEAGVFYCRHPSQPTGRIFSITDKVFPVLVGDGVHTVETLIWRHARYRMQAGTFLARLNGQTQRILARGEPLPLAVAGNHCQGTLFRDGSHLRTPALEARIDEIARHFDGFYFGRFDLRYADVDALRAGRGFAIIELNGASSESTNLYDPSWSLLRAYATLFAQWAALYEIGAENRRRGAAVSRLSEILGAARRHRSRGVNPLAD